MTTAVEVSRRFPLLVEFRLEPNLCQLLVRATAEYILACLNATRETKISRIDNDFFLEYSQEIASLPNRTPNGVLMPKRDVSLEFNLLHRYGSEVFKTLQLDPFVESIFLPVNVRIVDGRPDDVKDSRPYSSSKLHSDIWAGEPADTINVTFPVLGNIEEINVDYYEPDETFSEYIKTLSDYNEGVGLASGATKYDVALRSGYGYIMDSFTLHRTVRNGPGLRISIDFRFIARNKVDSDIDRPHERQSGYIDVADWYAIGRDRFFKATESIAEALSRYDNASAPAVAPMRAPYQVIDLASL